MFFDFVASLTGRATAKKVNAEKKKTDNPNEVPPAEQTAPAAFSFSNLFTSSNKQTTPPSNKQTTPPSNKPWYSILGGKSKKNRTKKPKKRDNTRKNKK